MRKIEAADLIAYIGTCLFHMVAENRAQRCLQQMCRGVIAHDGQTPHVGDIRHDRISY